MILQWEERNDVGEVTVRTNPELPPENAHTYAKHNHRSCNGTGLEYWDMGWQYYVEEKDGHPVLARKPLNPSIVACDCVVRHIGKYGL